jgi:hypothetical protein
VVICLLTAMVKITPSRTDYKAKDIAELMFENVYKHHGLPKTIVSDRDVLFTSTFWEHLNALIGIKLKMSSAYHPQTDGATERANRTITQMLRQCINPNQKDWVSKLPTIQFAINSARSESTGYAPFFLNTGRMPRAMIWNSAASDEYSNVREFALKRKLALMSAHDSIIGARVKQTRDANRKRQAVPFKNGDFVYLSTKNITFAKGLAKKLIPKFIGPYKIAKDFGNHSFKLELPTHLRRRGIHDVFHSSLLRIHLPNDDRLFPGRTDTQIGNGPGTEDEWAVQRIRSHAGSGEDAIFEILWKSGDVTWIPHYQIKHLQALEAYLELMGVEDVSKLKAGKGNPPRDDPQVFLGTVSSSFMTPIPYQHSYPRNSLTPPSYPEISGIKSSSDTSRHSLSLFHPIDTIHAHSDDILLEQLIMPNNQHKKLHHPLIARRGKLEYTVSNIDTPRKGFIHVAQIAKFLEFDKLLRRSDSVTGIREMPVGYMEFANVYNTGKHFKDDREMATIVTINDQERIIKAGKQLTLADFDITAEQCGLPPRHKDDDSAAIFKDYASIKAKETQRREVQIQARIDRRYSPFDEPVAKKGKKPFKRRPRNRGNSRGSGPSFVRTGNNHQDSDNRYNFSKLPGPVQHIPIDVIAAELQAELDHQMASTNQVAAEDLANYGDDETEYMEVEDMEVEGVEDIEGLGETQEEQEAQEAQETQYAPEVPQSQNTQQTHEIQQLPDIQQAQEIPQIKAALPIVQG